MGTCLATSSRTASACDCGQQHCCLKQCLSKIHNFSQMDHMYWSIISHIEQIVHECLQTFDAEFLTQTILQYLPACTHQKSSILPKKANALSMQSTDSEIRYHIYIHANISWMFNNQQPVCDIWRGDMYNSYKTVLIGSGGVGKTALLMRHIWEQFVEEYDPTISDGYRKQFCINPRLEPLDGNSKHSVGPKSRRKKVKENKLKFVMYDYLDFAGQEEFASMTGQWIREGDILLVCFAINDNASWQYAQELCQQINGYKEYSPTDAELKHNGKEFAVILVATKCDLANERTVSLEEVLQFAEKHKVAYLETSAKENINVDFVMIQSLYEYWYQSQTHRLTEFVDHHEIN